MEASEIDHLQVHDLVRLDPDSVNDVSGPCWIKRILAMRPWAVVRREQAPVGEIAVGFRGNTRSERWGGFIKSDFVINVVRPSQLLYLSRSAPLVARTPALRVLQEIAERWRDLALPWGPIGSVGLELASRRQVTTELSDIDIAIRAQSRITAERARSLWVALIGLPVRVDIRVETPECGFSLQEYATMFPKRILLRYPDGVRLGSDPWRSNHGQNNPELSGPVAMAS